MEVNDKDNIPDSVVISFDGNVVTSLKSAPWEYTIPSVKNGTTGRKSSESHGITEEANPRVL